MSKPSFTDEGLSGRCEKNVVIERYREQYTEIRFAGNRVIYCLRRKIEAPFFRVEALYGVTKHCPRHFMAVFA